MLNYYKLKRFRVFLFLIFGIMNAMQKLSSDFLYNMVNINQIQIKSSNVLNDFEESMRHALELNHNFSNTTLYVPASSVEAYKQVVGQYFKEVLPLTETGINQPNFDGMTISANQGSIIISGLKDGTQVRFYAVDGKCIGESVAIQGRVSFYCQDPMVIAKMGNKTLKIAVK